MSTTKSPAYGRKLDDFAAGDLYGHPWEVTVDEGMTALFSAAFQDAMPPFASRTYARALGLPSRPVHPMLLLNLGLSFSVHDVSEQAIAHLAYLDVRFPEACHAGSTVSASSRVLNVKPTSRGDRGVVEVRTVLVNEHDEVVCRFDRRALVRGGAVEGRPLASHPGPAEQRDSAESLPSALRDGFTLPERSSGFAGFYEDYTVGDVFFHGVGKTVGQSEHMMLTQLVRNSHPIHFDEAYCKEHSFAKTRVVYGGLVLSWVLALTSRDLAGNALWITKLDQGAHPSGVLADDTLYASSQVLAKRDAGPNAGEVTFRIVGTKNVPGHELGQDPSAVFTPELDKTEKIPQKVVEITATLLIRKNSE